jgi:hypothetical protein
MGTVGVMSIRRGERSGVRWKFCELLLAASLCFVPVVCFAALTNSQRQIELTKVLSEIMASATPDVTEQERRGVIARYFESKLHRGLAVQDAYRRYFMSEGHEDAASAAEKTLEGCQLRFEKPCAIVAVDDTPSLEVLVFKEMPRLSYSGEFDLSKIPAVSASVRSRKDVQAYFAATGPKAMAIHPLGFLFVSLGERSPRDAQSDALRRCNGDTIRAGAEGPCFIYAIANTVVLSERLRAPK